MSMAAALAFALAIPLSTAPQAVLGAGKAASAVAPVAERVIHTSASGFSEALVVSETSSGLRVLRFEADGARQSVVKLGNPDFLELAYAQAFPIALAWMPEPRRVLVVGLGGGSLPSFMRRRMPRAHIDVVELDPAVVDVAKAWFGFREDKLLRVHVGDGRRWIENTTERYDLIVLDAFDAKSTPYSLVTREFMQSVSGALSPNGVVVCNIWGPGANPIYNSVVRTYLDVFPSVAIVDLEHAGNKLLLAGRSAAPPARDEVLRRAAELNRRLMLRVDLVPMVRYGMRVPDDEERRAQVLHDAANATPGTPDLPRKAASDR